MENNNITSIQISNLDHQNHRRPAALEDFVAFLFSKGNNLPKQIENTELNTDQLNKIFDDLYKPKTVDTGWSPQAIKLVTRAAMSNAALRASTKSVCLLLLHRARKDPRMLHAATWNYSLALRRTRRQLLADRGTDRKTMIGTAHMLSLCEIFHSTSLDTVGARPHTFWFLSLLEGRRADPDSDLGVQVWFQSPMRMFAVWETMVARKLPGNVRVPEIVKCESVPAGCLVTLCNMGIAATSVAERTERLDLKKSESHIVLRNFLQEILRLEGNLHAFMTRYYREVSGPLYWTTPYPRTRRSTNQYTTALFPSVYSFSDLLVARLHVTYWMSLLLLSKAHLKILCVHHRQLDIELRQLSRIKMNTTDLADNLCMTVAFMGKPECGWSGRIFSIRPLNFLVSHFREEVEWQKLSWCMEIAAELEMLKSPNVSEGGTCSFESETANRISKISSMD